MAFDRDDTVVRRAPPGFDGTQSIRYDRGMPPS
jgi:hypothetical protein